MPICFPVVRSHQTNLFLRITGGSLPDSLSKTDLRVLMYVFFLSTGMFVMAPVIVIMLLTPFLGVALVCAVYGGLVALDRDIVGGLIAAVLVLVTFNADYPLVAVDGIELKLLLLDVPLGVLLVTVLTQGADQWFPDNRWGRIALVSMAGFVAWSFLSAIVGNGPSRIVALIFALEQLRFLALFVVGLWVVQQIDFRVLLAGLMIVLASHEVFGLIQFAVGGTFGLTELGAGPEKYISVIQVAGTEVTTGTYAGGFTGGGRILVAIFLMLVPVLLMISLSGAYLHRLAAGGTLLLGIFHLRISDTDAGLGAFLLTCLFTGGILVYHNRKQVRYAVESGLVSILTMFGSMIIYVQRGRNVGSSVEHPPDSNDATNAGGDSNMSSDNPTNTPTGNSTDVQPTIFKKVFSMFQFDTLNIRVAQYVAALRIWYANPLFGLGGRNFRLVATRHGLPEPVYIHNTYLALLAEIGFPGMLFYICAIFATMYDGLREYIRSASRSLLTRALLICGIVGYCAYSSVTLMYIQPVAQGMFALILGIVARASAWESKNSNSTDVG